jgi:hypothetical protein
MSVRRQLILICLTASAWGQAIQNPNQPTNQPGQLNITNQYLYFNKMHWAGAWSGATTYNSQDVVTLNGNAYVSLQAANLNNNPTLSPSFWATLPSRRACVIDNDTQSATALTGAQFSGGCEIPNASTIAEVDLLGGTGTVGSLSVTGTSSINLQRYTPNGGGTATILSAALATVAGKACALTATSTACLNGLTSSGSVTLSTTSLSTGDWVQVSASTADGAQTWFRIAIIYTIN